MRGHQAAAILRAMNLKPDRLQHIERSLELALNQEWPQLIRAQRQLTDLQPTPIRAESESIAKIPVVATVATDGGENRLNLDPIRIEVLRVADSNGEIYFEDFIPLSLTPEEILRFYFKSEPRLQKFLDWLGCGWDAVVPRTDFQRGNLFGMLRELLEWAALLRLAARPPAKLLIRDGLLRSVGLSDELFQALRRRLEELTRRHGHLVVGVAKRSKVLNYLTVALGLHEGLKGEQPFYVPIPRPLEREAAPAQYRWMTERAMGQLYVARLDEGPNVPLFPIDLAAWQTDRAAEAMALLRESARGGFPVRGYPIPLLQAHEHARLRGFEIEMLEQMLLGQLAARDPAVANEARLLKLFGRRLAEESADEPNTQA